MVLNVQDEIINGTPKYNITDNVDGTKNITLANEVVEQGTALNKALFNKIENVLSYQVPNFNQELVSSMTETYSGNIIPTDITPSWNAQWTKLGSIITQNLTNVTTTHLNITPKIEYISNLNNWVANEISEPTTENGIWAYGSWGNSTRSYKSSDFLNNSKRTSYSSNYNNVLNSTKSNAPDIIWDFGESCKPTFNVRIAMDGIDSLILYGSNDKQNWTELTRNSIFTNYKPTNYYRYFKIGFSFSSFAAFYGINIYYSYISAIEYKINTYSNTYNIPNIIEFTNNQRVLIQTPNVLGISISNTLNGIEIDTSLNANKFYELIYDQTNNKFIAQEVWN